MKKSISLLATCLVYSSITFSQISIGIKTPKLGKNKEEKKTENTNNKPAENTVESNQQNKTAEVKKNEPTYYYTNYPSSLANGKNYVIKSLEIYKSDSEWLSMHMKLEAEDGSKLNESYFEHYKEKDKPYYEKKASSSFIFPLQNGSYLLTNKNANVANLISLTNEHITSAVSKEELLIMAKELVGKVNEEEELKKVGKNDEEFKKVNQASKNAGLESQFKAVLTKSDVNLKPEFKNMYKKIILNSADWFVVNNGLGQPIKKVYNITYIAIDSKNKCFYGYGSVMKEHLGGGKYSDVVKFNGGTQFADGSFKKYISCELVK